MTSRSIGDLSAVELGLGASLAETSPPHRPPSSHHSAHEERAISDTEPSDISEEADCDDDLTGPGGAVGSLGCGRGWAWKRMERLGEEAEKKWREESGPKPQRLPDGTWVTASYWGIKRHQLEEFYHECREDPMWNEEDSVADFVPKFVIPRTGRSGMGLALLLNQESPARATIMISHAWQGNAGRFFEDVLGQLEDFEVAFVCFLSNFQGTRQEINDQLGEDICRSPFTEVLSSIHCYRLLVVPNEELMVNGEGLYSRLWCDWEIKVAADMGLPIHFTHRSKENYLFGSSEGSCSSEHARCGNPKDQKLIKDVIEKNVVEHGKFQSVGVFLISVCVAYGPRVAVKLFGSKHWIWVAGYPAGIAVGLLLLFGVLRPLRSALYWFRGHDGYRKLDSIIKSAAKRKYEHRRFRPSFDVPLMAAFSLTAGLFSLVLKLRAYRGKPIPETAWFFAILGGFYEGIVAWPIFRFNSIGPWTGVFVLWLRHRALLGVYLFCLTLGSSLLFSKVVVLEMGGDGQGALWGMLVGLASISLFYRRWWHAGGLLLVLGYMVYCYFLMREMKCWLLWRETILVALGALGYLMVPGLSRLQTVAAWLICPCFVVGLAGLSAGHGWDMPPDLLKLQEEMERQ